MKIIPGEGTPLSKEFNISQNVFKYVSLGQPWPFRL